MATKAPKGPLPVDRTATTPDRRGTTGPPKVGLIEPGRLTVGGQEKSLAAALGTEDRDMTERVLAQVARTLTVGEPDKRDYNYVLAALHAIGPQNPLEGMLAVQAVGCHNLAMRFMGLAAIPDQTFEGMNANVNRAARMSRTFTALLDTLGKLRGNAGQKMEVRHVHVADGGQAVIGNVQGGGGKT